MNKLIRPFATCLLIVSLIPSSDAQTMGTNPKPRAALISANIFSILEIILFTYGGIS